MDTDDEKYLSSLVRLLSILRANSKDDTVRSMLEDIQTLLRTHALPAEHPLAID